MKRIFKYLLCLAALGCSTVLASARDIQNFNLGWRYAQGDHAAAPVNFNDSQWEQVGIPHSFSIPYFQSKDFYTGYGWYRNKFHIAQEDASQSVSLEFDGVFQEAEVYINGQLAGHHVGGYTGFTVDVTHLVKVGENVVAVRVNNLWQAGVAPRAGEHVFSGGIYRNVRLVKKNPLHIGWYGIAVTTAGLEASHGQCADVVAHIELENNSHKGEKYEVRSFVIDADKKVVAQAKSKGTVAANSSVNISLQSPTVKSPRLWTPAHPNMYKLVCEVRKGSKIVDTDTVPFGFRWVNWSADNGFSLNGERVYIKGANAHQDHAGWGDAVTEKALLRDVRQLKEAGFNFIRGSHYPHSPAYSSACDSEGMLYWSEAPFWGIGGFTKDGSWNSSAYPVDSIHAAQFEESALAQLGEMIKIHRNHPSIVAWSMCNEAFFSYPEAMPGVRRLLKRMVALTHILDSSRPAAIGGCQRPLGDARIDLLGDVAGYNGDGATLPDFQNPPVANMVSEYGSVACDRPGKYNPGWSCLADNDGWKGYQWRAGQAIWCAFDHGSIAGSRLGKMGIVDYFRIPKRAWYWYRNEYTGVKPEAWPREGVAAKVRLSASEQENIRTDGTDDVWLLAEIIDASGMALLNSPAVTLEIIDGPGTFPTGRTITFAADSDIRIQDGKAAIAMRAYHSGAARVVAKSEGLASDTLTIHFIGDKAYTGDNSQYPSRAYRRYDKSIDESVRTYGPNNPTAASSNANGMSPGLGADGNANTYWRPASTDASPYWMVDTEKGLLLNEILITFPQGEVAPYVVEVSLDHERWTTVYESKDTTETSSECKINLASRNISGGIVRVRFSTAKNAGISEISIKGRVL